MRRPCKKFLTQRRGGRLGGKRGLARRAQRHGEALFWRELSHRGTEVTEDLGTLSCCNGASHGGHRDTERHCFSDGGRGAIYCNVTNLTHKQLIFSGEVDSMFVVQFQTELS